MQPLSRKHILKVPAVFVALAIFFLSSQSVLPTLEGPLAIDKVQHCIAYTVLSFCTGFWFLPKQWTARSATQSAVQRLRCFLLTACIASFYGVTDEFHQLFTPGRDCSVYDWVADSMGALLGAALSMLVMKLLRHWLKQHRFLTVFYP
jgi:VanZ family protein